MPTGDRAEGSRQPEIWLVRHAESTWNAAGRWQGHGDPPLSPRGRAQARAVADRIRSEGVAFDALHASDLRRAAETARAIGSALGLEVVTSPRLRELDVGRWTGLTRAEIEAGDPELLMQFEKEDPDVRPGGGETRREIRARVRAAVRDLAITGSEGRVLFVVHLGVVRALVPGSEPDHIEIRKTTLAELDALAR